MIGDLPSPPEQTDKNLGDCLQRTNSWGNRNTSFRMNFEEKAQVVEVLRAIYFNRKKSRIDFNP